MRLINHIQEHKVPFFLLKIGMTRTTLSIRVKWEATQGFLILGGFTVSALVPLHKLFKTISVYISVFVMDLCCNKFHMIRPDVIRMQVMK
jgi:hypothetical protein